MNKEIGMPLAHDIVLFRLAAAIRKAGHDRQEYGPNFEKNSLPDRIADISAAKTKEAKIEAVAALAGLAISWCSRLQHEAVRDSGKPRTVKTECYEEPQTDEIKKLFETQITTP